MFEEIGHHAEKIRRIAYGPLSLDVEPGEYRKLTEREVRSLTQAAGSRGGSSWPGLREPKAVRRSGGRVARESAE
jgi:23S rRNA pseudouridine2605 synthase